MKRVSETKPKSGGRVTIRADRRRTIWHPLSLQQLPPDDFIEVVNRILDGRTEICAGTLRSVEGEDCVYETAHA